MLMLLPVGVALLVLTAVMVDTVRFGAPPMPSSLAERRAAVALVTRCAPVDRPVRVVEAGAGWGGLAAAVVAALPDAQVLAVEGAMVPFAFCWLRTAVLRWVGRPSFSVRRADFRTVELGQPDVVLAFLGPESTAALARRLAEDHPTASLVSVGFSVPGWRRVARVQLADAWRSEVAVWTCPAPE